MRNRKVNEAVYRAVDIAVDDAVWWAVTEAVWWAVDEAVYRAVPGGRSVRGASNADSEHPALQDFLHSARLV